MKCFIYFSFSFLVFLSFDASSELIQNLKVEKIIDETVGKKMTIIAGIPSWVQMYFEKIITKQQKSISKVFPDLSLYVYGGVSYEPYKIMFERLFGKKIDTLATFPASEGFFGYQDEFTEKEPDLLLLLNNDIFYEFIKTEDFLKGEYVGHNEKNKIDEFESILKLTPTWMT